MPGMTSAPLPPTCLSAEALLAQKNAIVNWAEFYAGNNMTG